LSTKEIAQSFPSEYSQLKEICRFVTDFAHSSGFSEEETYQIAMAVDEACSNIIEHAYGGEKQGVIDCSCNFVESELIILLRDDGRPFSPGDIPKPNINAALKKRKNHGLGYFFMQNTMDDVSYSPNSGNGNLLSLRKKLG
jgi:serine/threonine-protein kinase RsbW